MKQMLRSLTAILLFTIGASFISTKAQIGDSAIFDPTDPVVVYDPGAPPQEPVFGEVGKWVKTNRVSWNTTSYKAYIYKGLPFRLKFPKNYDRTKKYPLLVFFHGLGEYGTIYDNEYQLYHGGELHKTAVDNNTFDGFLLYPQNQKGQWSSYNLTVVNQLIESKLISELSIDPFRIYINGLSGGGSAAWSFTIRYSKLVAALLPISATASGYIDSVNRYKFTPIWHFQGGLDIAPTPASSRSLGKKILAAGGNYRYKEFPDRAHDCWYQAWREGDYFPFMKRAHKANPWALFGRTEFCPGDTIKATLGVTVGFDGYEWRKDGVLIPGAISNQLVVTTYGTYDCHIKRGAAWSVWSPTPVVIKQKTVTISPDIQVSGSASNVIPSPDGNTTVQMEVPENYTSYNWQKEGNATVLSMTRFFTTNIPGNYKVKVTEQYGCSSEFSKLFAVVNAAGSNGPAPVAGLLATAASKTSIQLNWSQHASPANNETAFEVYQATATDASYKLVQVTAVDATGATIEELASNTKYFYKVRAVNGNGASDVTGPVSAITQTDTNAPTAPENLRITFITRNSVDLLWNPASDDVGVTKYDIYIDGVKTYVTENAGYSVYNLTKNKTYNFSVKARDFTGNTSPFSNQVTATTIFTGLTYKYYEGVWNVLPNFTNLTPVKTGTTRNIDLAFKNKPDSFAFLWEGYIRIPVAGSYTFRTRSNEGSKLYLGAYSYSATALVNNDGLHSSQDADGVVTLNAGVYPIAISFFDKTGGESISVSWKTPLSGSNFAKIPDSVFAEASVVNGQPPLKPTNLTAIATGYKNINLTWTDNSTNETDFEILRSLNPVSSFTAIKKVSANINSYSDTLLEANTTYYYRVRAVNQFGESGFDKEDGNGVNYTYYESTGLTMLPDFNTINPVEAGRVGNFGLGMENRTDNFQVKFDGFLTIPTSGTYTFYTTSDDGSKLYIGEYNEANLVVNNDGGHAPQERSGTKVLAAGTYPIFVTFFQNSGGKTLAANISGPGLAKQAIPSTMLGSAYTNATTQALPNAPQMPTNLLASASSSTGVNITWSDNASTEDEYELYRSSNTNSNYILIKTLPANTTSYSDTGLFSNSIFYYKVKAVNAGGGTASVEDSTKTLNNSPVITAIENQYIKYGTQLQLNVAATDADPETVTLQASGLPSFANFVAGSNGKAVLTFNPAISNQGTYAITITAADQNNGLVATTFRLVVSDNNNPHINAVGNVSMNEKAATHLTVTATDADAADVLNWSFKGLPSFATVQTTGGSAQINFAPGYANAGTYVVAAGISDNKNGFDTTSFTVTVADVNVDKKYCINFNSSYNVTGIWNNIGMAPVLGAVKTGFKDALGAVTTVGIKVLSDWGANGNSFTSGAVTGNNSGIYPDLVMKTGWYAGKIEQSFQLTGLDANLLYNLTFFNSKSVASGDRTTVFTINGNSITLNALNNIKETVTMKRVQPATDGTITIFMKNGAISANAYINAMVIESGFDDGTAPVIPASVTGVYDSGKVKLDWKDIAYNETEYGIYRSTSLNGIYEKLKVVPRNTTTITDSTVEARHIYFYKVQAANGQGTSGYTDAVRIDVPNFAPVVAAIPDQRLKNDSTVLLSIKATDDPADVLTITGVGFPSFASITDNGNGTASLNLSPAINNIGVYKNVAVAVMDNNGGVTTKMFTITVTNKDVNKTLINFNATYAQAAPWNNFSSTPVAGKTLSNLKDENGSATGINITLTNAWQTAGTSGAVTGSNSGVFPDNVIKTYYSDTTRAVKHIQLSGLSTAKKYNLSFFASRSGTGSMVTKYTAGGQTVALNAIGNKLNTVKINGLVADLAGKIDISIVKDSLSGSALINALVVEAYNNDVLLTPTDFIVTTVSKSSLRLTWTDNNAEETGFEIWRSLSANGDFNLVNSTAPNITSYTDDGLAENQVYYYKIRAKAAALFSSYSNVASSRTLAYLVYQNFNLDNPASNPWNNTNSLPEQYAVFENLINDQGNLSGISTTIVSDFSGFNPNGMTTGNNAGVVPDNVMRSSYYCGKGVTARLRIDGLSQVNKYNFVFFGSREGSGDRTSVYKIGNESVSLNGSYNTTQTVQINGVKPDENGSVYIDITNGPLSQYAYLNGLIIQGYSASATSTMGFRNSVAFTNTGSNAAIDTVTNERQQRRIREANSGKAVVNVYPNPFTNEIAVQIPVTTKIMLLSVKLSDISGRVISLQQFKDIPAGLWQQRISLKNPALKAGTYFIQVDGLPEQNTQVVKLVKLK